MHQDILEGALLLWRAVPYFPASSIHVAVVDPGVGTQRRGLAGRLGNQYFVGPDNGIFSLVLERAEEKGDSVEWVHLDKPGFWLPRVTSVFHGRDVFSPVAAHLANGVELGQLGTHINDPVRLSIPQPEAAPYGWLAHILHIDHFGNLSTNLHLKQIARTSIRTIHIGNVQVSEIVDTFGARRPGDLIAFFDSSDMLAIAVVNGSAASLLGAQIGETVEVITI